MQDGLCERILMAMSRYKPYDRTESDAPEESLKAMERTQEEDSTSSDDVDDLDEEDRRRLHEALASSEEDVQHGRIQSADDVMQDLRRTLR